MTGDKWNKPCYDTVSWTEVEADSTRICRTKSGSWKIILSLTAPVVGNLLWELYKPKIKHQIERYRDIRKSDQQKYQDNVNNVIPFINEADVFVGQRRPWVKKKLSHIRNQLQDFLENESTIEGTKLTQLREAIKLAEGDSQQRSEVEIPNIGDIASDDQSVYESLDAIGSLSANEYFQTLDLVVSANLAMSEQKPSDVILAEQTDVDFGSDVVSIGGPIPNYFTRNILYSDELSLPYRFELNPKGIDEDLSTSSPELLRETGLSDDRQLGHRPNWSIVDQDGNWPTVQGASTIPQWNDGQWDRDYFMVAKVPNIHPAAPALNTADTKRALILAGCHGLGTRAALNALKYGEILETIDSKVDDGFFQLLGRVKRNDESKITADDIEIPDEHLQKITIN